MIVDAHTHLGSVAGFYAPDCGPEALLSLMDALGIDVAVQIEHGGLFECFEEAYAASRATYEASGGRLRYALVYHPRYASESLGFLRRGLAGRGAVAIKIHPGQHQVFPEDPSYEPAWQLAAELGVPLVTHSWALSDYNPTQRFATPEHFEHYVARYPQVNLILGHAGGRYEGHLVAVDLAQRYPNVYLDLSGDVYSFRLIEWLVEQAGADRLLFGSDAIWMDPRTTLGRILDADITPAEKAMILGGNACRLFRLPGAHSEGTAVL
jgi:predicted TIM-barrel fold metal-dependent hydrolase